MASVKSPIERGAEPDPIRCVLCRKELAPADDHVVDVDGIFLAESAEKPVCAECASRIISAVVDRVMIRA